MEIEFDPEKSAKNEKVRGLPFELVRELEWATARIARDVRRDYGEERFLAFVPKDRRLHFVCFCLRQGKTRVISFRKANEKEVKAYGKITDAAATPTADATPNATAAQAADRRTGGSPRTDR
jgi:uncharacterized protein